MLKEDMKKRSIQFGREDIDGNFSTDEEDFGPNERMLRQKHKG